MTNFITINESIKYGHEGNADEIYNLGEINIIDIKKNSIIKVNTSDIIRVVNDAMFYMQKKFPYLYSFINACKVMYIPTYPSEVCNTMCVDTYNNLWINMNFVYNECAMNKDRVFGILFHEMFHIFLEHILRFNDMFPEETKKTLLSAGLWKSANKKANLAMDYEINASMVEDNIVTEDFWKKMNGLYKKEYTGKTWEEIYTKYGDKEYEEWSAENGIKISEAEMKILEAIEKAAKVLKDPSSTDEDKAKANRELQKTIDKILGRDSDSDIQDVLEEMKDTRLGEIGEIGDKMQDVIDDLYKNPSKMSDSQYDNLMEDIDKMADEMIKNAEKIADTFKKSEDDVLKDVENMRKTIKDSITQMREKKMSKAIQAVGDAKACQNRGACADGGNLLAICPGKTDQIQRCLACLNGGHTAQTAGQHNHFQLGQIHFFQCDIRSHANAVTAFYDLAADPHCQHGHTGPAQQVNGRNGLGFLKALSEQYINHIKTSLRSV